jgi:hypothetical protein
VTAVFDDSASARVPHERSRELNELAVSQNVAPISSADDLALDVWSGDDELDAFLDDVRTSRHADVA